MTPYKLLANAIIIQAVKDYRNAKHPATRKELERFFRSEWFSILSNLNGEVLLKQLQKETVRR